MSHNNALQNAMKAAQDKQAGKQQQTASPQEEYSQPNDNWEYNMNNTVEEQQEDFQQMNWARFDELLVPGMELQSSGANVQAIVEAFREVKKNSVINFPVKFTTIDTVKYAVALPAIVAYYNLNGNAFIHTLLLADRQLEPHTVKDPMGLSVEVVITPADVYSSEYIEVVREAVAADDKGVNKVFVVGAAVLPSSFSHEDTDAVTKALYVSCTAIMTTARTKLDHNTPCFNYDRFLAGVNLRTRMDFTEECVVDRVGMLHRADVQITMSRQQPGRDAMSGTIAVPLTRIAGFIDLHYVQQQQNQGQFGMMTQIVPEYYPRYVMTHFGGCQAAKTIELELTALGTANICLFNNTAYKYALKPNTARTEHDRRDIGALAYDVATSPQDPTWRGMINTKSTKFGPQDLNNLMQALIIPELGFAMDCVMTGEDSWITNVFVRAAMGKKEAIQKVMEAADRLTNGRIRNKFNPDQQALFSSEITKIHMGEYTDPLTNEQRDLRDWDEVAVMNYLGKSNLAKAQVFGSTFDSSSAVSEEARMDERLRIIKSIVPSAKVTGYAMRLTPNAAFIMAIGDCMTENPTIRNQPEITGVITEQQQRGMTNMRQFGANKAMNGMYSMGGNGGQGGNGNTSFTQFL